MIINKKVCRLYNHNLLTITIISKKCASTPKKYRNFTRKKFRFQQFEKSIILKSNALNFGLNNKNRRYNLSEITFSNL